MSSIVAFLKDESGATAIEYGLMAAGISVVILATLNTVGSKLNAKFDEISGLLKVRKNSRADLPEAAVRAAAFFRPLSGQRGHDFRIAKCPLMTQSRHCPHPLRA